MQQRIPNAHSHADHQFLALGTLVLGTEKKKLRDSLSLLSTVRQTPNKVVFHLMTMEREGFNQVRLVFAQHPSFRTLNKLTISVSKVVNIPESDYDK